MARLKAARRVVILTACEERGAMWRPIDAGAAGYVIKRSASDTLLQAVRGVAAGGTCLDPAVAGGVIGAVAAPAAEDRPGLSDREVQVLEMVAQGYSNKEIAAKLCLSVETIETYKTRSLEKLGVRSRVDVVRHALRSGWLADGVGEEPAAVGSVPVR